MNRHNIFIEDKVWIMLKKRASKEGITISELIRRSISNTTPTYTPTPKNVKKTDDRIYTPTPKTTKKKVKEEKRWFKYDGSWHQHTFSEMQNEGDLSINDWNEAPKHR